MTLRPMESGTGRRTSVCSAAAWGDNSHSAKGPRGQSQGVPEGFSVRFSEFGEGARGPEGCEEPVRPPGPLELAALCLTRVAHL